MTRKVVVSALGLIVGLLVSSCSSAPALSNATKAQIRLQMASNYFNQRNYGRAIDEIREAIKEDPGMAAAYNHLALVYLETKRYPKSMEAFEKALQLQPNYPEAFNNIGVLLNRQERYKEAIPWLKKAADAEGYLTPENALTNLGYAYYKLGNLDLAIKFHRKAIDVAPMFCLANKNLGDVYAKKHDYKRAAQYFGSAVTHCPLYQEGRYKLALVNMKLGNKKMARSHFQQLIDHHKDGPYVDRSQEVLKLLR